MKDPILRFAAAGDIAGISTELARGVSIEKDGPSIGDGNTPLLTAIRSPRASVETLRYLLAHGADANRPVGELGTTPLGAAISSGDVAKVAALLDAGADIHFHERHGYDALLRAVICRDLPCNPHALGMIEFLLSRGADSFSISEHGESALRIASHFGRFDIVARLLDAGADAAQLGWTPLQHAVALGCVADIEACLAQPAPDLEAIDWWNRTAWLLSLQIGNIAKAERLRAAGVNVHARGRCGKTALMYPIVNHKADMLRWLLDQGFDTEARDDFDSTALLEAAEAGATECVRVLLAAGADAAAENHIPYKAIELASNLDIVELLVQHGEALQDMSDDMRRQLLGLHDNTLTVSTADYRAGKRRRFGSANPQRLDVPFWTNMAAAGVTAWAARGVYDDEDDTSTPVWCYDRFGRSLTRLPDGRLIEIGGEHEDYYDPDFCIYNDVVVHDGHGNFTIWSYPEAVFPPTDFHSATLVGDYLYIIGRLGYQGRRRFEETPVFRLDCQTLAMETLHTTGEKPGWISSHQARHNVEDNSIVVSGGKRSVLVDDKEDYVDNVDTYRLDLESWRWSRVHKS